MTKEEVTELIQKKDITEQDKIKIFNWYLINSNNPIFSQFQITTATSNKAKQLLDYSMIRIEEYLGLRPKVEYVK